MTQKEREELPELQLYRVGAEQIDKFAPLFTREAAEEVAAASAAAVIAVENDVACGGICMKLAEGQEELLDLLSLYVVPEYRRRGVAGTLFLETMEEIFDATDGLVHCCRCLGTNDAEGLEEFLAKAGFVTEEEEGAGSFLTSVEKLQTAPVLGYGARLSPGCELIPVEELSALSVKRLFRALSEFSVDYMQESELPAACGEISYVALDAGKEPAACAIFTEREGRLCLSQFYMKPGASGEVVKLLQTAIQKAGEKYGGDKEVEIPILSDSSCRLMEKLLGTSCKRVPLRAAYYEM